MWIAGPQDGPAAPSATTDGISIAVGPGRTVLVLPLQRLRAVMSPCDVVARMSSSAVPSFLRELLTRP